MDGEKFDKIAKVLSNDTTRRGVLGGLAGILASVVGGSSAEARNRKRAQGGKRGNGDKPKKCRKEGHPCEGNQECCKDAPHCWATGPGKADRCTKKCPKDKCNCSKCPCKSGADCATGCCHKGYCCPKDKCPPPECPTKCPTDFCGDLKVPKGCPPVKCECPKGYECKDYKCVPIKCPTTCPTDYCGEFEVPKGCPPVTCPKCPKGYECKDHKCVPVPVICTGDDSPKQCPPPPNTEKVQYTCKDVSTCPVEYHGVVEVACVGGTTPKCVYKQNQPDAGKEIKGCAPAKCSNPAS